LYIMSFGRQIILFIFSIGLGFFSDRMYISGLIHYRITKHRFKTKRKGESLKEWFLYSRWKEEIPKIFLISYFFKITISPLLFVVCIILNLIDLSETGRIIALVVFYYTAIEGAIIHLLFLDRRRGKPGYDYSKYIKKSQEKTERNN